MPRLCSFSSFSNDLRQLVLGNGFRVFSGQGTLLWQLPGVGGTDLAVGQMDDDPALEIATTDGSVIDAGTRTVQWRWFEGFGLGVEAIDVDRDGRKEVLAHHSNVLFAFDVERQLPRSSFMPGTIGNVFTADTDGNGADELVLLLRGARDMFRGFDPVTLTRLWSLNTDELDDVRGVTFGDVDGDGLDEVVFGQGDLLVVGDPQLGVIEWTSLDTGGALTGPDKGDLDGDGKGEIVVGATSSSSGRTRIRPTA